MGIPFCGRNKKKFSLLRLGAWNIRTLQDNANNPERRTALIALELSRYNLDIVALSETRLPDSGQLKELSGGYTFFWKGKGADEPRQHGVGFAIKNDLVRNLQSMPIEINDRLMTLRIPVGKSQSATLISAYAPTMTNPDEAKDKFYSDLESVLCSVPAADKLILLGDFNARVGLDTSAWPNVLGPHGVGSCNSNGLRLLSLCAEFGLFITNTNFSLPVRNRTSWMHPRSKHWHLIDYVIVRKTDRKDVLVTKAMCGAECGTDHRLIVCKLKLTLRRNRRPQGKAPPKRLDVSKLCSAEKQSELASELSSNLDCVTLDPGNIEQGWTDFNTTVHSCASSTVGFPVRKHQDWFNDNDDEIKELIRDKNSLIQAHCSDPSSTAKADALRACKGELQKKLRTMKNDWFEERVRETQKYADTNNTRKFFESLRAVFGPSRSGTTPLLASDDSTRIIELNAIIQRWAEHFGGVLNRPSNINTESIDRLPQTPINAALAKPFTADETRTATNQMSFNKSPGVDSIPAEVYAFGGEKLIEKLTEMFNHMLEAGELPQDFKDASIIHLYKNKGDRQVCDNHRGISLLSIAGKILARMLLNRLLDHLSSNDLLPESQCGFRKERGTADMIFAARQIQEKCLEQNEALYITFVDLTKAFDTVCREGLWKILAKFGCPPEFITMVRQFHDGMQATVKSNGSVSEPFAVTNGVKQGCVLAPTLFSIMFSAMLQEAFSSPPQGISIKYRTDGSLFNLRRLQAKTKTKSTEVCDLLFADDCALLAHDEASMQNCVDKFSSACDNFGLTISTKKTEVLHQPAPGDKSPVAPNIKVHDSPLKVSENFTYLGSTLSSTVRVDTEIASRISKASSAFGRLRKRVWDVAGIRTDTKLKVYNAVVLPTLLYGAETWTVYQWHARKLNHFHLACLRKILRIKWQDKVPDTEVLNRAKELSIFCHLKKIQLRWAGHVVRMPDSRLPKQIFFSELSNGRRNVGAPKRRYKDTLKQSLKAFAIDVSEWEKLSLDRPNWRAALTRGSKAWEADRVQQAITKRERRKKRPSGTEPTEHSCHLCGRFFRANIGLISHMRSHKS